MARYAFALKPACPFSYLWRRATARDRAVALFAKLGVWNTEHNNGVLIYLLLAERRIELVADRGLNRHVDAAQWAAITESMATAFGGKGLLEPSLSQAVNAVTTLLVRHFALLAGRPTPTSWPTRRYCFRDF